MGQTKSRHEITYFCRSTFDVSLNYMPYVKPRFKKSTFLILPYSELRWYNNWEPVWVKC